MAREISSFSSTSIEGNPLPLTEAKKILKSRPETYATAAVSRCPLMSFFCDEAEPRSGHTAGEPGVALTLDQAAETAKVVFWDFLYDRTTPHP